MPTGSHSQVRYITLRGVMNKYQKTYVQVRYATETSRLDGFKIGWQWLYREDTLPDKWPEAPRNEAKKQRELKHERG